MRKTTALILTVDEAKELLANWYADLLVNDRQHVYECVLSGGLVVPKLTDMTRVDVAALVSNLNAAEKIGLDNGVDQVFVSLDDKDDNFYLVWDRANMDPQDIIDHDISHPAEVIRGRLVDEEGLLIKDDDGLTEAERQQRQLDKEAHERWRASNR